jgi:UDP-N-acetylglucosamine 1-carboxyvinyltransferase
MTIADCSVARSDARPVKCLSGGATQAKGSVLIHQKMFESSFFFVDKLI